MPQDGPPNGGARVPAWDRVAGMQAKLHRWAAADPGRRFDDLFNFGRTAKAPGHVGLVISKNTMIEAYATGTPVRVSAFGTAQSPPGDGAVVGYARPWPNQGTKVTTSG
jgi:cell wall-associated NlpC family hydrolase